MAQTSCRRCALQEGAPQVGGHVGVPRGVHASLGWSGASTAQGRFMERSAPSVLLKNWRD